MKKAKIVLSAVALFAVVGGAFAFKANRSALKVHQLRNGQCSYLSYYNTTNPLSPTITLTNATVTTSPATTIAASFCSTTISVAAE